MDALSTSQRLLLHQQINENLYLIDSSQNKNIVIFIGKQSVGKSTLINYLCEKDLIVNMENNIVLANPSDPTSMKIGKAGVSETLFPKPVNFRGLTLYDMPSIQNASTPMLNIANSYFLTDIITKAASVKLVFVIDFNEIIIEKGKLFKEFINMIKFFLPNQNVQLISSLIITKSPAGKNKKQISSYLINKVDGYFFDH